MLMAYSTRTGHTFSLRFAKVKCITCMTRLSKHSLKLFATFNFLGTQHYLQQICQCCNYLFEGFVGQDHLTLKAFCILLIL